MLRSIVEIVAVDIRREKFQYINTRGEASLELAGWQNTLQDANE